MYKEAEAYAELDGFSAGRKWLRLEIAELKRDHERQTAAMVSGFAESETTWNADRDRLRAALGEAVESIKELLADHAERHPECDCEMAVKAADSLEKAESALSAGGAK